MHTSALTSVNNFKKLYLDPIQTEKHIHVVELGSLSINSNVKKFFDSKFKYTSLDIVKEPNVDLVLDDPYTLPFENNSIDVVISISTFEHTDFFWLSYL